MNRIWLVVLATIGVAIVAACSPDDEAPPLSATSPGASDSTANDDLPGLSGELPAACAAPPFELAIHSDEDRTITATDAMAIRLEGGLGYTIWTGDYAIDRGGAGQPLFDPTINVHEGNTLVTIFLTVFNPEGEYEPLAAGDEIPADAPFGDRVFGAIITQGSDSFGSSTNPRGTAVVEYVDDALICLSVDFDTEAGVEVEGRISAEVVAEG